MPLFTSISAWIQETDPVLIITVLVVGIVVYYLLISLLLRTALILSMVLVAFILVARFNPEQFSPSIHSLIHIAQEQKYGYDPQSNIDDDSKSKSQKKAKNKKNAETIAPPLTTMQSSVNYALDSIIKVLQLAIPSESSQDESSQEGAEGRGKKSANKSGDEEKRRWHRRSPSPK